MALLYIENHVKMSKMSTVHCLFWRRPHIETPFGVLSHHFTDGGIIYHLDSFQSCEASSMKVKFFKPWSTQQIIKSASKSYSRRLFSFCSTETWLTESEYLTELCEVITSNKKSYKNNKRNIFVYTEEHIKQQHRHAHRTTVRPAEGLTTQCGSNFGFRSGENLRPGSFWRALNVRGCRGGKFHGQLGSRKCLWSGCLCKRLVMVLPRREASGVHTHTHTYTGTKCASSYTHAYVDTFMCTTDINSSHSNAEKPVMAAKWVSLIVDFN